MYNKIFNTGVIILLLRLRIAPVLLLLSLSLLLRLLLLCAWCVSGAQTFQSNLSSIFLCIVDVLAVIPVPRWDRCALDLDCAAPGSASSCESSLLGTGRIKQESSVCNREIEESTGSQGENSAPKDEAQCALQPERGTSIVAKFKIEGGGRRGEKRTTTVRRDLVYGRTETIRNAMFCSELSKDHAGNLNQRDRPFNFSCQGPMRSVPYDGEPDMVDDRVKRDWKDEKG